MKNGKVLKNREGRVRLGWRLLLFLVLFAALTTAADGITPAGLAWGAGAELLGALGAGWIVLLLDGRAPGALGFGLRDRAPAGLAGGLVLGVVVAGAAVALIGLAGGASWSREPGSPGALLATGGAALWTFALPAAAEEALFRGYPLQALAEAWGPVAALWATSLAFGMLHLGNPGITWLGAGNIALAGLFLGALCLRTGSLWWATGAHLGWNWAVGFGADLPVSGLDLVDTPYLAATEAGPAWLSGGGFGPEGSVLAGVILAAVAAGVWRWWGRLGTAEAGEARPLHPPPPTEPTRTRRRR